MQMNSSSSCPKCGGASWIQGGRILDRDMHRLDTGVLTVEIDSDPKAWILAGEARSELRPVICGGCGYTELYAVDLEALRKANEEAERRASSA